jgi:hypothetical protein
MNYLTDENKPIDVKMALINQLGWNTFKKSNPSRFLKYLMSNNGYKIEDDFYNNGNGDQLLCMSYLKAIYNYHEVDGAIRYSERALTKSPKSYTFQIISALIKAQKSLNSDWCKVYRFTDEVRRNTTLDKDMKEEAIAIIFKYMDNYKDSCNNLPK